MSSNVKHREVGIYIIFTVLEAIAEGFENHMAEFFSIFERLLVDPESLEIRITTVRALGVLAQYIDLEDKRDLVGGVSLLICCCSCWIESVSSFTPCHISSYRPGCSVWKREWCKTAF